MKYARPDIYLCECCGQFFNVDTDAPVHVPYEEMPAEVAIKVMLLRQDAAVEPDHKPKRPRGTKAKKRFRFEP